MRPYEENRKENFSPASHYSPNNNEYPPFCQIGTSRLSPLVEMTNELDVNVRSENRKLNHVESFQDYKYLANNSENSTKSWTYEDHIFEKNNLDITVFDTNTIENNQILDTSQSLVSDKWTIVKLIPTEDYSVQIERIFDMNRKRQRALTSYRIGNSFIACEECKKIYLLHCICHIIGLVKNKIVISEAEVGNRAFHTAPWPMHIIRLPNEHNWAVISRTRLPKGLVFGPYEGILTKTPPTGYSWMIEVDLCSSFIDGSDKRCSNWLRFVNCSDSLQQCNLQAFQYYQHVYYKSTKIIARNDELLVWAGDEYARAVKESKKCYEENLARGGSIQYDSIRDGIWLPMKISLPSDYLNYYRKKLFSEAGTIIIEERLDTDGKNCNLKQHGFSIGSYENCENKLTVQNNINSLNEKKSSTSGLAVNSENPIMQPLTERKIYEELKLNTDATKNYSASAPTKRKLLLEPIFCLIKNVSSPTDIIIDEQSNDSDITRQDEQKGTYFNVAQNSSYIDANKNNSIHINEPKYSINFNEADSDLERRSAVINAGIVCDENEDQPVFCLNCNRKFCRLIDLAIHDALHAIDLPLQCGYCGIRTIKYLALKNHMNMHIHDRNVYEGKQAEATFVEDFSSDLVMQLIKCDQCIKHKDTYDWKMLSMLHVSHDNQVTELKKELARLSDFDSIWHKTNTEEKLILITSDAVDEPKRLECIICFEILQNLDDATQHQSLHKHNELHQCNVCLVWFASKDCCFQHSLQHENLKQISDIMINRLSISSPQHFPILIAKLQWILYKNTKCSQYHFVPNYGNYFNKETESIVCRNTYPFGNKSTIDANALDLKQKNPSMDNRQEKNSLSNINSRYILPFKKRKQPKYSYHPKIWKKISVKTEDGKTNVCCINLCESCNSEYDN